MSVRSADRLALVTLVRMVPALVIEDAVRECGQEAGRVRTLPPWVTAYHVLAAAMSPSATFDEITELLWSRWAQRPVAGWRAGPRPRVR